MYIIKIMFIILLLIFIQSDSISESFTAKEIENKSRDIFRHKNAFVSNVKYKTIKNKMNWIDPVTYNDIYKLSNDKKLSINNIKETLNNSIL